MTDLILKQFNQKTKDQKHHLWSYAEEQILIQAVLTYGKQWKLIHQVVYPEIGAETLKTKFYLLLKRKGLQVQVKEKINDKLVLSQIQNMNIQQDNQFSLSTDTQQQQNQSSDVQQSNFISE